VPQGTNPGYTDEMILKHRL